eukprot:scaffold819_cov239-Pinguiococcus_pyrenoidosus.AAC.6
MRQRLPPDGVGQIQPEDVVRLVANVTERTRLRPRADDAGEEGLRRLLGVLRRRARDAGEVQRPLILVVLDHARLDHVEVRRLGHLDEGKRDVNAGQLRRLNHRPLLHFRGADVDGRLSRDGLQRHLPHDILQLEDPVIQSDLEVHDGAADRCGRVAAAEQQQESTANSEARSPPSPRHGRTDRESLRSPARPFAVRRECSSVQSGDCMNAMVRGRHPSGPPSSELQFRNS